MSYKKLLFSAVSYFALFTLGSPTISLAFHDTNTSPTSDSTSSCVTNVFTGTKTCGSDIKIGTPTGGSVLESLPGSCPGTRDSMLTNRPNTYFDLYRYDQEGNEIGRAKAVGEIVSECFVTDKTSCKKVGNDSKETAVMPWGMLTNDGDYNEVHGYLKVVRVVSGMFNVGDTISLGGGSLVDSWKTAVSYGLPRTQGEWTMYYTDDKQCQDENKAADYSQSTNACSNTINTPGDCSTGTFYSLDFDLTEITTNADCDPSNFDVIGCNNNGGYHIFVPYDGTHDTEIANTPTDEVLCATDVPALDSNQSTDGVRFACPTTCDNDGNFAFPKAQFPSFVATCPFVNVGGSL